MLKESILESVEGAVAAAKVLRAPESLTFIADVASLLAETFRRGSKLLIAGNGGSLCDASHFAEELTGQFRQKRPALPALALSDPSHLTCVANDHGFDQVFARGVEAFGQEGDVFVGLTTSGKSPNIIRAFEMAQQKGLRTVAFLGKDGGALAGSADLEWIVCGFETSDRIQEAHMAAIHIIIEEVERLLGYA